MEPLMKESHCEWVMAGSPAALHSLKLGAWGKHLQTRKLRHSAVSWPAPVQWPSLDLNPGPSDSKAVELGSSCTAASPPETGLDRYLLQGLEEPCLSW